MKAIKFFAMMLVVAAMALGTTSCGDDEPSGATGTLTVTVNGDKFTVDRAYWSVYTLDELKDAELKGGATTFYYIHLYNCDYPNVKDPWHSITIAYTKTEGATNTFADGTFSDFEVSLSILSEDDSKDRQYYAYSHEDGNNGVLKVSHDGGVTLSVSAMKYTKDPTDEATFSGPAFTFSGSIKMLPNTGK